VCVQSSVHLSPLLHTNVSLHSQDQFSTESYERSLFSLQEIFPNMEKDALMGVLEISDGDLESAVTLIFSNAENSEQFTSKQSKEQHRGIDNGCQPRTRGEEPLTTDARKRYKIDGSINVFGSTFCDSVDSLGTTQVRAEEIELFQSNFLLKILYIFEKELKTVGERCLVCNCPIDHSGVRPVVCSKELCTMGYEELGVGLDVEMELVRDPNVVDLQISLLYSAAHNGRVELAFPATVRAIDASGHEHSFLCGSKSEVLNGLHNLSADLL